MQQKHFFFLVLISVANLIGLYSCKKTSTVPTTPTPPTNTLTYDGFTYHTVTIPGAGTWTVENARNAHFRNGDPIRNAKTKGEWQDSTERKITAKTSDIGAWCYYENTNDADIQNIYGKLYNGYAVNDVRGLAPQGWHVATDADFTNLTNALGDSASQKLKSALYWIGDAGSNNPKRDSTKFTAVPTGSRSNNGAFILMGTFSYFWSSTEIDNTVSWFRFLNKMSVKDFYRNTSNKLLGASVRFVQN